MWKNPSKDLEQKANKNLKFSLRMVSKKTVEKATKRLNKKKSAGGDGLSQDNLILGLGGS